MTDGLQGQPPLIWWSGTRWQKMLGETSHRVEVRFGKVWTLLSSLESGLVTPLEFKGKQALTAKTVVLTSLFANNLAPATRNQNTEYWTIGTQAAEPEAVTWRSLYKLI